MARRTGVPTLLKAAIRLCRLISKYESIIINLYPENNALIVALSAALVACGTLQAELVKVREYGD